MLAILNRVLPLRVSAREEAVGLNISEHGAKTDTYELFQVMDQQVRTQDLSLRVSIDPFTEVGHIATRYNQVMANLDHQHRQQVDDLEQIYYLVTIAAAAVDSRTFRVEALALDELIDRGDELGNLARVLQQLVQEIETRDGVLALLTQGDGAGDPSGPVALVVQLLEQRFGALPAALLGGVAGLAAAGSCGTVAADVGRGIGGGVSSGVGGSG